MSTEKPELKDRKIELVVSDDQSLTAQHARISTDKLIGTVLDNKIEIEGIIGQGGMSIVYKGRHLVLNQPVAVKVLLPGMGLSENAVMRLQQEAKAAYSLSHKNLTAVHDVALTSEGWPYLVMDFAAGETLASMLERGPIEPKRAIEIFSQICQGLSAAHSQGVIHRDIKPGNIMVEHLLDGSDHVRIVDFGIAKKVTENADEIQKLTQTGEVFGTPLYMSPEQCRGERLGKQSDIYSLGCVFYEAITGTSPFKGDSAIATILNHLNKPFPLPDRTLNISDSLVAVLKRCLEKDAADRYQTMDELRSDLELVKYGGTPARYASKSDPQKQKRTAIRRTVLIFTGALLVALAGCLGFSISINSGYDTIAGCNSKIAKNPYDEKAYLHRANLNMANSQYTRAAADYSECIRLSKNPAYYYAYRSSAYLRLARYNEALQDCDKALQLIPNMQYAIGDRASILLHLSKYEASLADAETFLKSDPNNANMLRTKARALINLGRFQETVDTLTYTIKVSPDNSQAYADRAWAYDYLHETDKAIADATIAIALNRESVAYSARGYAHIQRHEYDKALEDLQAGLEIAPGERTTLTLKAKALAESGKPDQAIALLCEVIRRHPTYAQAWKTRSQVYKILGKDQLSSEDLQRFTTLSKSRAVLPD